MYAAAHCTQFYGLVTDVIGGDRFYTVDNAPGVWFAPVRARCAACARC
jgi:hypothetical protein